MMGLEQRGVSRELGLVEGGVVTLRGCAEEKRETKKTWGFPSHWRAFRLGM